MVVGHQRTQGINCQKCVSNFLSTWLANPQEANHGMYSNPGTQVRAQNKDLSVNCFLDGLTRVWFHLRCRLIKHEKQAFLYKREIT